MPHHRPKIVDNVVPLGDNQRKFRFLSKFLQSLQAALVLGEGMNIGIIPERGNLQTLLLPMLNTIGSTRGTAGMKK
jgi:predicted transcriptional regulator